MFDLMAAQAQFDPHYSEVLSHSYTIVPECERTSELQLAASTLAMQSSHYLEMCNLLQLLLLLISSSSVQSSIKTSTGICCTGQQQQLLSMCSLHGGQVMESESCLVAAAALYTGACWAALAFLQHNKNNNNDNQNDINKF